MKDLFNKIRVADPKRSKMDLTRTQVLSCNMGKLIPFYLDEIVPTDVFKVKSHIFMRTAPLLSPMMHKVDVYTHYFFVPTRLLWDEWEKFITGGEDGLAAPVSPYFLVSDLVAEGMMDKGTVADYFGLPVIENGTTITDDIKISALPFRAQYLCFKEFYRDQTLQQDTDYPFYTGSGLRDASAEIINTCYLYNRAWEKDYFTSALPFAQRGPQVGLPLEVVYKDTSLVKDVDGDPMEIEGFESTAGGELLGQFSGGSTAPARIENIESLGDTNINDLRRSIRLQEWLEKNARAGARYVESLWAHFKSRSDDARLQRPEYLGGGKQPINISEVLSTFESEGLETEPLGTMAGRAISAGTTRGFNKRFKEHGFVIGFMSVLPRTGYQQGVPRLFTREDKLDYYWPSFAHIGEQEIRRRELYYNGVQSSGTNNEVFGYTPRYAEYKFGKNSVHGDFRDTLSYWHMNRIFETPPNLNAGFVQSDPTYRVFAVDDPSVHHLYCEVTHRVDALRPMPYFGTPTL